MEEKLGEGEKFEGSSFLLKSGIVKKVGKFGGGFTNQSVDNILQLIAVIERNCRRGVKSTSEL
jgi:hypothetical protein